MADLLKVRKKVEDLVYTVGWVDPVQARTSCGCSETELERALRRAESLGELRRYKVNGYVRIEGTSLFKQLLYNFITS